MTPEETRRVKLALRLAENYPFPFERMIAFARRHPQLTERELRECLDAAATGASDHFTTADAYADVLDAAHRTWG